MLPTNSISEPQTAPAEEIEAIHQEDLRANELPASIDRELVPVIGLGGSAGSIDALQKFFERIPADLGMAYVVVIHLSPDFDSSLDQVIQARTSMPVVQVQRTTKLKPNSVYVIPPSSHLAMEDGYIHLTEPHQEWGKRVAIDLFFRTLATTHRSKGVAVVLSGMDGDGAIGIKRVKEHGGVTVAQDPNEAEFDGMPRAAIETGMVDWILPVERIADKLVEFIQNEGRIHLPPAEPYQRAVHAETQTEQEADEAALREVLAFVNARTGNDFSHYKRATVLRRIMRRLQVNSLDSIPNYAKFLRTHPGEAGALLQDLLISVTNFFRDPESFQALSAYLPHLFRDKTSSDSVRVWVAGCATGEEAYSLAMLLLEQAENLNKPPEIQIFATDLDDQALRIAREAVYPATIMADISPERLRRFFSFEQGRYRIKKEVRERVLFASHNLLKDSPFSRLDLVSCRNLMIYFNHEAQSRVFDLFHFSLQPNGLLFLGSSESADTYPHFTSIDKKCRIYKHQPLARAHFPLPPTPFQHSPYVPEAPRIPEVSPLTQGVASPPLVARPHQGPTLSFGELHLKLLEQTSPPSVLINRNYEMVHLSEKAGRFLRHSGGEISNNLLSVVPTALRLELRAALFRAVQSGEDVDVPGVLVKLDGETRIVGARIRPLRDSEHADEPSSFVLVIFDERTDTNSANVPLTTFVPDSVATRLEAELQHVKEDLRLSVEQYEASVEELKASNEELQAMNEEQRSASEELETSREEIQAANEELVTVNTELKSKVEEISRANSDLQNLMAATDIATVFLSRDLRIKRYTPPAVELFNLIPTDSGRPLADLRHRFEHENFTKDAETVEQSLSTIEREIRTSDGRWFLLRISPYRTTDDKIDGVILTFIDISKRKRTEEALIASEERCRIALEAAEMAAWDWNLENNTIIWNERHYLLLGLTPNDHLLKLDDFYRFVHPDDQAQVKNLFQLAIDENDAYHAEFRIIRTDGQIRWMEGYGRVVERENGKARRITGVMFDVTERRLNMESLKHAQQNLELRVKERTTELEQTSKKLSTSENIREQLLRRLVDSQEEERRRISRELHDNLGQSLSAISMATKVVEQQWKSASNQSSVSDNLKRIQSITDELMRASHQLAWDLRPAALDNLGLEAALEQYLSNWGTTNGIEYDFINELEADNKDITSFLTQESKTALFRVAQESLTNVVRHSGATHVTLILEQSEQNLVMTVEDNGHGYNAQKHSTSTRLGIVGMKERLESVGGILTLELNENGGLSVQAQVPIETPPT